MFRRPPDFINCGIKYQNDALFAHVKLRPSCTPVNIPRQMKRQRPKYYYVKEVGTALVYQRGNKRHHKQSQTIAQLEKDNSYKRYPREKLTKNLRSETITKIDSISRVYLYAVLVVAIFLTFKRQR